MNDLFEKGKEVYKKTEESQRNIDNYLNEDRIDSPFKTSITMALSYCIISVLWIKMSDELALSISGNNQELFKTISLYKGWFFVLITTILLFLFVLIRLRMFDKAKDKLYRGYEELTALHEELIATQEELEEQYDVIEEQRNDLNAVKERYQLAVEGANDGIWEWDRKSDAYMASILTRSGLKGKDYSHIKTMSDFHALIHEEDSKETVETFSKFLASDAAIYETTFRLQLEQEEYVWILSRAKAIRDENGNVIRMAGSHTDITKWKEVEKKLFDLAYKDELTKLPNRAYFEIEAKKIIESCNTGQKVAIIYFDIDNFKHVNDSVGHHAGNELLKYVGNIVEKCVERSHFVARIGGDEFAIILHCLENEEIIYQYVTTLAQAISRPWYVDEHQFFVTTSIGVVVYPNHGKNIEVLLRNADTALFEAKAKGKNCYSVYNKVMEAQTNEYVRMAHLLQIAIYNEDFILYYQPKFNLKTKEVCGMEALIRWNHKERGFISPSVFIPLAEQTGLISTIEKWVFETGCRQMRTWIESGIEPVPLSINLSGKRFIEVGLVDTIVSILKENNLDSHFIQIEITETAVIENYDMAIYVLNEFRKMGIRIELDDFGKGYSSLSYLKSLPVDILKIDRDFIQGLEEGNAEDAIVKATVELAHKFNLEVIAEGIETEEQRHVLLNNGCDLGQGYYYSEPIPAKEMTKLFNSKVK